MPVYIFKNDKTGKVKEIVMRMNEEHVYIDESGYRWTRIFSVPKAAVNTKYDPFSSKDFVRNTRETKGTYGDLQDRAAEAAQKRKDKAGYDPVKKKYWENLSKTRKGRKHPAAIAEGYL
jgi:predicted nucleic acid-binding Zn ribbon protein